MIKFSSTIKAGRVSTPEPVFVFPPRSSEYWDLTPSQKSQYERAMAWARALTSPAFNLPRSLEAGK